MGISQSELKKLMQLYYTTTGSLLFWREDENWHALSDRILDLILAVQGKEEYREACREVIGYTAILTNQMDCSMLKLSGRTIRREQASFFNMKADEIKQYKIDDPSVFDMDVLLMDNHQGIINGEAGALRLGACLGWLGLDEASSSDAAIRYWTVLAYTGDFFAMEALEYACAQREDAKNSAHWRTVRQICEEADRLFTLTVPAKFLEGEDQEAANTAQMILAVRDMCANDEKERLPMPMLQYAMDSKEEIGVKLRNLRIAPETHYELLMRQSRKTEEKHIGF